LIREFPISELVANPGHRIVRNPEAIDEIAELIRRGNFPPDLSEKSPAINIVTDEDHRLQYVDVWEGHHRMLAHLTAGNLTLGHLNFEELRIYINGELASDYTGKSRPHLVPSYGVDFEKSPDWFPLHPVEDRDPGKTYQTRPDPKNEGKKKDIIVDARNSNYSLGSRESLQHVLENIRTRSERRVGILWLDLTRGIPDADAVLALPAEAPEPITDLVLIPQEGEFSRTQLNEIDQLRRKVLARKPTLFLNAYVGPESGEFARKHGKENLVKRIQQAFLTGSSSTL
jgi:hypothetical protein